MPGLALSFAGPFPRYFGHLLILLSAHLSRVSADTLSIVSLLTHISDLSTGCHACRTGNGLPFAFSMAFQPIVNTEYRQVYAHEALVRGVAGESAGQILSLVDASNMYAFDQACRVRAIELAAALATPGSVASVSINFIPGAVYKPEACIRKTLETAARVGMPLDRIIFEVTEGERVTDRAHLKNIFCEYRKHGLLTAIDDFGAGYAGLTLLAEFQPDLLKIDMELIRNIDQHPASRVIVKAILEMCADLGVTVIAEGIESVAEWGVLRDMGIQLFQGYLFAKPHFEAFAQPALPMVA